MHLRVLFLQPFFAFLDGPTEFAILLKLSSALRHGPVFGSGWKRHTSGGNEQTAEPHNQLLIFMVA